MRQKKTHYKNMNQAKADEIRRLYFERKANQKQLAEMYGIKQNSVSRIISGLVWNA